MTDYRVTVTVKNARILQAMEKAGFDSVAALAKALGVSVRLLYPILSMQKSPLTRGQGWNKKGSPLKWRPVVESWRLLLVFRLNNYLVPNN